MWQTLPRVHNEWRGCGFYAEGEHPLVVESLLLVFTIHRQTLTRDYIIGRQPWDPASLPPQYCPDGKLRWFPPLFLLGVILTIEEVCYLAKSLGLSIKGEDISVVYGMVAHHLSTICGFEGPNSICPRHHVTVEKCDAEGWPWMVALVSNYQMLQEFDYSDAYTIILEVIEKAFGGSKKIEWWLEHTVNHTPKDHMVCGRYHSRCRRALIRAHLVAQTQAGMDTQLGRNV